MARPADIFNTPNLRDKKTNENGVNYLAFNLEKISATFLKETSNSPTNSTQTFSIILAIVDEASWACREVSEQVDGHSTLTRHVHLIPKQD